MSFDDSGASLSVGAVFIIPLRNECLCAAPTSQTDIFIARAVVMVFLIAEKN